MAVGEGRIISVFNETRALLSLIIEGVKAVVALGNANAFALVDEYAHTNKFISDAEAARSESLTGRKADQILLESQVKTLPQEFVDWIGDSWSAGEFGSWISQGATFDDAQDAENLVNKLETILSQAPGEYTREDGVMVEPGIVATPEAQIEWLKRAEEELGKDLDTSGLDEKNQKEWDTWIPKEPEIISAPDTTYQSGEQDMPGLDTPPRTGGAQSDFGGFVIGDDPSTLAATPKTRETLPGGDLPVEVEVEDDDPYDLGGLVDEIGGLDYFTGPDWIINPEDIPRGLPEISGPMNVVDYMSMYEVSPSRAKELLRKTAGFAKYTKWDADWAVMTPEEQDKKIANTQHEVWIQARLFGIDVPENHPVLREIALKIERMNWSGGGKLGASDERVREIFYNHKELLLKRAVGQHDVTVDKVKTAANNWMVSLSKEQRDKYAQDIELGVLTIEGLEQTFQDMAYKNYPTLRGVIDGGSNLLTYSDPYATGIETILDREIDFNGRDKEMFDEIFMGSVEDDGVIRPKTWGEAKKYVRETSKYGWDKTPDAKAKYRGVGEVLLQKFGAVR